MIDVLALTDMEKIGFGLAIGAAMFGTILALKCAYDRRYTWAIVVGVFGLAGAVQALMTLNP